MSKENLALLRTGKLAGAKRLDLACGLTEFPCEIFELADSLEVLNLTHNHLASLPDDLGRLHRLRVLFCSENNFTHVPAAVGQCPSLSMVGFRANEIETVDAAAFPPALRWLILTDNEISELPASLAHCVHLRKLMLSGNRLRSLPETLAACENLELLRLAANELEVLPDWLMRLPSLSWLALAGNPCAPAREEAAHALPSVPWTDLQLGEKIGEGASGLIYQAAWMAGGHSGVAVKLFKGEMTSDGLPHHEMEACATAGPHENLIAVLGRVSHHPAAAEGLVMELIDPHYRPLAGPPSLETCTRDVYAEGLRLPLSAVVKIATAIASVAEQLHARGILHGDLYAHNILWRESGACLLGDFGAASFYDAHSSHAALLERLEVRAFGCLLEELLTRCAEADSAAARPLQDCARACVQSDVTARPSFAGLGDFLRQYQR